ncbi:MAG: hypothetical protein ABIJ10_02655 [Candidatus Micrarchaeota archaeon]|nr:hypothetical protein [Candidatus Micrarchaeota archaeon]
MRQRTIKVSEEEWEMLNKARNELVHRGCGSLPKHVQNEYQTDEFTKGAIVGLGVAALLYLLAKER